MDDDVALSVEHLGGPIADAIELLISKYAHDILLNVEAWPGVYFNEHDGGATMRLLTQKLAAFALDLQRKRGELE